MRVDLLNAENVRGLARAFIQNLQGGQIQGGSSITVQVAKQNFFTREAC